MWTKPNKMAMIFWVHAFLRTQGAWKLRKNMKSDVLKGRGGDADLPFLMILILIRTGALIWECTEPSAHWCRDTYLCVRLISRGYICQSDFPILEFLSQGCIKLIGRHEQLGKGKEIDWSSKSKVVKWLLRKWQPPYFASPPVAERRDTSISCWLACLLCVFTKSLGGFRISRRLPSRSLMWGWSKKSPGVKKHPEIEHFPSGVGVDKMVKKSFSRSKDGEIS